MVQTTVNNPKDFFFKTVTGEFPGLDPELFGGQNPGLGTNNEENIDNIRLPGGTGSVYTYLTSAATLFASSSSASDTMTVIVVGLDADYNVATRLATLSGQTPVALNDTLIRMAQTFVIGGTNIGDIYISEDDTDITDGVPNTLSKIKGKIDVGLRQGNNAQYTAPAGKKAYLYGLEPMSSKAADTDLMFRFRAFGPDPDFNVGPPFQIFQTPTRLVAKGIVIPEKSDVDFTAKSPTGNSKVTLQMFVIEIPA